MTVLALRPPVVVPSGSRWVLLISFAYLTAFALSAGPVVQLPLALLFFLTCPGMILADWLDIPDTPTRLALGAAGSLGVNILAITMLLSVDLYSTTGGLITVVLASVIPAVVSPLVRRERVRMPSDERAVFLGSDPEAWPSVIGVRRRPRLTVSPAETAESVIEVPTVADGGLWHVDSTAWNLADDTKIAILSVVDEPSRVCVISMVSADASADAWLALMRGAENWVLPEGIAVRKGIAPESNEWHRGLDLLGIRIETTPPTLASRFHQTMKKALRELKPASEPFQLQAQIDDLVHAYNFERPHRSIGRLTPAAKFAELNPSDTDPLEVTTHTVDRQGRVEIPGPHILVVPARHAGRPAATVREDSTVLIFVDGAPIGHVTLTPGRRLHRVIPFPESAA